MRIVFVAYLGSPHTRRWVSFFAERGHEVHVVTCGGALGVRPEGRPPAYAVHDLGPLRLWKLGYLTKLPRARSIVRSLEPDLVHAHYATSYGLLGLASGVRPFVVTAHGSDLLVSPRNRLMRRLVARVLRSADLVTVPSDEMLAAVDALVGPSRTRVEVFQYGVETERLALLGSRLRSDEARPRIVSARPLFRLYRVDALLEALGILARESFDFTCEIAGDGPERARLEALAEKLGLAGRVVFHGRLPPGDTERLLARADVYVSVAESDGASIALLEAMALGAVPVLSDIPSNRPWVEDGETGVLVDVQPAAIASGIRRAALLDSLRAAALNRERVRERAERGTNLGALESLLVSLSRPRLTDESRDRAPARAGRL